MTLNCVLIDVDTQRDFLDSRGALPVSNRSEALAALRKVMAWARARHVPVVSSMDTHRENEPRTGTATHCLEGSVGQQKLPFTLLRQRRLVETDSTLSLPIDLLAQYKQVIFRKRSKDFFSNPKADRLLTSLDAMEILVCGVGLESSIRSLVLGLIARHKRVTLILEACGTWNRVDANLAAQLMEARGARIASLDALIMPDADGRRNGNGHVARSTTNGTTKHLLRPATNGHATRNGTGRAATKRTAGTRGPARRKSKPARPS